MLGVNVPLSVDIYDLQRGLAVAGCTYYAAHPGGLSHEQFPINANAAESRRLARLQTWGAAERQYAVPPEEFNAQFPRTLDLRRPGPLR